MFTSIFGVVVNIGCAALFVLVFDIGIEGLALASAISSTAIAAALLIMINKRREGVITGAFMLNLLKTFICGVLAFIAAKYVFLAVDGVLGTGMVMTLVKLCVASLPACVVYFGLARILKVTEMMIGMKFIFGRKHD